MDDDLADCVEDAEHERAGEDRGRRAVLLEDLAHQVVPPLQDLEHRRRDEDGDQAPEKRADESADEALGVRPERLRLRDHDQEELSHYSCGTADIEYAFPFLPPGEFGELEGIAHRGDFDLRSHMEGKLVRQGTVDDVVGSMSSDARVRVRRAVGRNRCFGMSAPRSCRTSSSRGEAAAREWIR